eukprot:977753-Prorocentrum_minimum.AAC.3
MGFRVPTTGCVHNGYRSQFPTCIGPTGQRAASCDRLTHCTALHRTVRALRRTVPLLPLAFRNHQGSTRTLQNGPLSPYITPSCHSRIQFSRQFFAVVECPCRALGTTGGRARKSGTGLSRTVPLCPHWTEPDRTTVPALD